MKKIILLATILVTQLTSSQSFRLTVNGFVNEQEPTKDYVVLEFPNKTKQEIYKAVLIAYNGHFRSPKNVMSVVQNESITISAIDSKRVRRTNLHSYQNKYVLNVSFKDGKIKIDAPVCYLTTLSPTGDLQQLHLAYQGFSLSGTNMSVYNKKGKVKYKKAVTDLTSFANKEVAFLKAIFNSKDNDW